MLFAPAICHHKSEDPSSNLNRVLQSCSVTAPRHCLPKLSQKHVNSQQQNYYDSSAGHRAASGSRMGGVKAQAALGEEALTWAALLSPHASPGTAPSPDSLSPPPHLCSAAVQGRAPAEPHCACGRTANLL